MTSAYIRCKVCDVLLLSAGRFTEMHDDRAAWFTNTDSVLRFEDVHEMKLTKQNQHRVFKWSFLRSFQSPSAWEGNCLMLVSGPMAAFLVGVASNRTVEVGTQVHHMTKRTSSTLRRSFARTLGVKCACHHVVEMQFIVRRIPKGAFIPVTACDYGESGRAGDPHTHLSPPQRCLLLLEYKAWVPLRRSVQLKRCPSLRIWGTTQSFCDLTVSLRLWQCWMLSVTELVDANPLRKWSLSPGRVHR